MPGGMIYYMRDGNVRDGNEQCADSGINGAGSELTDTMISVDG